MTIKKTIRILTFLLLLGAVALPGPAFAQSGNPDDATVLGGEYTLESGERVDDLTVLGGNVLLEEGSSVRGDSTMFGGNLTVAGEVNEGIRLTIVAYAMELTPLIGWIVPILVGFVGMGGVLLSRFGSRVYPAAVTTAGPSQA